MPAAARWPNGPPVAGSTDFLALLQANAPWPRAMANTQVLGSYAAWITAVSDQDLQPIVAFLNTHNMGMEIEAPTLQALATCGSDVEGYVPYGQSLHDFTLAYLQRLQGLGAQFKPRQERGAGARLGSRPSPHQTHRRTRAL